MSLKIEANKESNSINPSPTPNGEEESRLQEDACYSCIECTSVIEILDLDEENNILSFKCPKDGLITIPIKEYLENMKKNTFLCIKCSSCKVQQNEINNNDIFKYCFDCKKHICIKCCLSHHSNHKIIGNDELNIKCSKHPDNKNKYYCIDCNMHLCENCLKPRKHMMHQKINLIEIEPTNEEINTMSKLMKEYKKKVENSRKEKNNILVELKAKYKKEEEKAKEEYDNIKLNSEENLKMETVKIIISMK